jgi:hypothetical protein
MVLIVHKNNRDCIKLMELKIILLVLFMHLPLVYMRPFYVVAHMTNSIRAVNWALTHGANAVEIDLRFDKNGNPAFFFHGGECDCRCAGSGSVCSETEVAMPCNSFVLVHTMLDYLASKPSLALIFLDTKIEGKESFQMQVDAKL